MKTNQEILEVEWIKINDVKEGPPMNWRLVQCVTPPSWQLVEAPADPPDPLTPDSRINEKIDRKEKNIIKNNKIKNEKK